MKKETFFPSVLIGAGLALALQHLARSASAKPTSHKTSQHIMAGYLEEQMQRLKLPGAALAIVEGDQIVHLRGFGRAHSDGSAPTPQTPFMIGSTTKSITALAVMQLVDAGKIELDAPVQRYLPWFRVADPHISAQITVRHLLNQTSGLPLLPGWALLSDFDDRPSAAERQARQLISLQLKRLPGVAFEYSNLNYNLLGLVIEAASGEQYPAYIQKHIFEPLEMRHSYSSKAAAKQDGLAQGHQTWFGFPKAAPDLPVPSGSLASGQLICSVEDMAHYLLALLNGGRYGQNQLLSPAGTAELIRPAVDAFTLGDRQGQYGMGWYIEVLGQTRIATHTGMTPDFFTFMALLPEQKKGLILLINADHFTMQMTVPEIGMGLTALLAGVHPAPIQFGWLPWVMRALLLIPLLQLVEVVATLRKINRWRKEPASLPGRKEMWGRHLLLPLIPNLLTALTLVPLLSKIRGFLMLFAPDFSWIALISGGFASIWIFLRTGLILRALSGKPSQSDHSRP
jgi:CubicO group peptidase (beta-lactamase class C family)